VGFGVHRCKIILMDGVAAMMLWKVVLDLDHMAYILVGQPGSDLNFKQVCFEQLFPIALISKQPSCIQGQRSAGMGCRSKDFCQVKLARQDGCLCGCQVLLVNLFGETETTVECRSRTGAVDGSPCLGVVFFSAVGY